MTFNELTAHSNFGYSTPVVRYVLQQIAARGNHSSNSVKKE